MNDCDTNDLARTGWAAAMPMSRHDTDDRERLTLRAQIHKDYQ
jgi:hypothetical protein